MPSNPPQSEQASPRWPGKVVHVTLIGRFSLRIGNREIMIASQKGRALIGYLAFTPNHKETRGRLAGLFWRDKGEEGARMNLRQDLRKLRETFVDADFTGFSTLQTETVGFEPGSVRFDVHDLVDSIANGWPDDKLLDTPGITDQLLVGYEDATKSDGTWVVVQRESLRKKLLRLLQDRFNLVSAERTDEACRLARALEQLDPTHEPACAYLMAYHADHGDSAAAIALYNALYRHLDEYQDTYPSSATQALAEAIKSGTYEARPAINRNGRARSGVRPPGDDAFTMPPPDQKLVLIVSSFGRPTSSDHQLFAFRHELIRGLSKFREWAIIDGEPAEPAFAAGTPCYTLSAPMFEGEGEFNLMLSLKDSRTGHVVLNESYSIAMRSFVKSLKSVMLQLAAKLNVYISVARLNQLAEVRDKDLDIYDRWLRGQSLFSRWQPGDWDRARQAFISITKDVPTFSPAYSSLAQAENAHHIVLPGTYRTIERHHQALVYAENAVTLDPLDSRAHLALAWAHALGRDHDQAANHFDQACALNEHDAWTITSAALGYAFGNQIPKALDMAALARTLTPSPRPLHWCYQSTISFVAGDYQGCIDSGLRVGDAVSNMPAWVASAMAHLGRSEDARVHARRFVTLVERGWVGATIANEAAITRWMLQCFPIKDSGVLERLRAGLAQAGLVID